MERTISLAQTSQATIKDIARELGLSVATVSRALSRPELLKPETRARVLEVTARLGYQPNLIARGLRLKETRLVFVVTPRLSPYFLEVFRGVELAARESGYDVLMGHTDRSAERERLLIDQVASRRADGVILVTSADTAALAERKGRIPPLVAALESVDRDEIPTVRVDNTDGGAQATRHLIGLGHTRIAHIAGPETNLMARHRREGFELAMREAGLNPHAYPRLAGEFIMDHGEASMKTLLTLDPPPTAVFAANDEMAIGALQAVKQAGRRIGVDMSVIGFDDQRIASLYEPALTTVHVPTVELGYRSMQQLLLILGGGEAESEIVLPTKVVARQTTGPAPAGA
jgi:LacI family repressor for deo operon, udp, cdd, tsx, nupC, and nupG